MRRPALQHELFHSSFAHEFLAIPVRPVAPGDDLLGLVSAIDDFFPVKRAAFLLEISADTEAVFGRDWGNESMFHHFTPNILEPMKPTMAPTLAPIPPIM